MDEEMCLVEAPLTLYSEKLNISKLSQREKEIF
jgi:hypothetical protein